ncbi:uncharacterized protein K02A2.6-like [Armigeres subalbatus]|uniref:uncharacterized protein K02A2.6-like n=1 Tax=Armigeres subalbatus TaxID=124917 RepID=UPI002ED18F3D
MCPKTRINYIDEVHQASQEATSVEPSDQKTESFSVISYKDALVSCRIGTSTIEFLIDSGSDVNVIGGRDWEQLKQLPCFTVHAYATAEPMVIQQRFSAKIETVGFSKPSVWANFVVVPEGRRSLLGRRTAGEMKLLKIGTSVNACEESEPQSPFPKMPGVKVRFCIDKTIPPVRNAYYNVPAAFREAARKRLQDMEAKDIIEKVSTAPEWISGMSAVAKGKGDFRLVVNMRAANKAIKREYFRLPPINEMKTKLHGARYFSKLDLSNAYYHLELEKGSRDLTTFLSEYGMYRFKRLMFGVNCAPEIFQREMTRILKDFPNVIIYIDDILIFAETLPELRKTVADVMQVLRANNLTINPEKCEFDQSSVTFLGHKLDEQGFHIDEAKTKLILEFRRPATASELRSFLGLASFLSPHIRNFADLTRPLWTVAAKNSWEWGAPQTTAFEAVKEAIAKCTVTLGYFCEMDRTILYTDASPIALGAVLVQVDSKGTHRIISFASKALTPTERRYAQNQREALGAVWGVEHFAYFLLGRHFTLRVDSKGISFILSRSREDSKRVLTRADGWALRLSPYNYEVEHVKGSDNIADPPSRLYTGSDGPFDEDCSPWEIARLEANPVRFLTEDEIREATAQDDILSQVMTAVNSGEWSNQLNRYRLVASDLYVSNGLIVKNGCIVIPKGLREKTLEVAHSGHPLSAKFKSILRERVWWPGMPSDAENWVKACSVCATNGKPEKPTPMQRTLAPKTVWEAIAVDFNGPYSKFGGIYIFVLVDYRSRYIIARPVKSTSFEYTKLIFDEVFDREGFPQTIKSDNGPPFNGEEYRVYCSKRGIVNKYSTPLFLNKRLSRNGSTGGGDARKKSQKGLPLLKRVNVHHDEELLNKRDREAKLRGKKTEDSRRSARKCRVKPGDVVIVERQMRAKGDSRFDSKRYTVIEETNGSLLLVDEDGSTLKRHVTQTKKYTSGPKIERDRWKEVILTTQ